MAMAQVLPLENAHHQGYEAFLQSLDGSLLYYSLKYRDFLEGLLGCEARYFVAMEEERITGVLPAMETSGPLGKVVNSLPYYGSNGGVLASTPAASSALRDRYAQLTRDAVAATWIENPLHPQEVDFDLMDKRIGHFSDLTGIASEEDLLRLVDGSARRNVKKAHSCGVSVGVDNGAFDFLTETHRRSMKAIGGKAKTVEFFHQVSTSFQAGSDYNLYLAELNGTPIAGLLLLYYNRTVEYFVPVTVAEHRSMQPMAAILVQAMLDATTRSFTRWNWGGTWLSQEGVARFKRKWGAQELPYRYFVTVGDLDLLARSERSLETWYPGFYVAPFSALQAHLNTEVR